MMLDVPKISIIIPVFNSASTIEKALNSVIDQTYEHKELIIINNNSTDGTGDILERYKSHISKLITEKDEGIYDAMNKAIGYCTGDWIFFLGSDDEFYNKDVLTNIFSKQKFDHNYDIIYGNAFYIHRKTIRFKRLNRYKLAKHNFNHQTIFYPSGVFRQFKYETKYKLWADYYLNIQLFFKTDYKFIYRNLIITRFNDKGASGNNEDREFIKDKKKILHKILPLDALAFYYGRNIFIQIRDLFKKKKI